MATWNPSDKGANVVLSNGNLTLGKNAGNYQSARATISKAGGKWYWEVDIHVRGSHHWIGIGTSSADINQFPGQDAHGYCFRSSALKYHNNINYSYGTNFGAQVIGIALDLDVGKIWFAKENVWQESGDPAAGTGEAFSGISGTFFPMYAIYAVTDSATARFISNNQGYTPPSGFKALGGTLSLFDGKITISPKIDLLDGKTCISPKIVIFDGKARIKDAATNLLDGKIRPFLTTTNCFDGKATIHPLLDISIEFPSLELDAVSGPNAIFDEEIPLFELEASVGGNAAGLVLPLLTLEAEASSGSVILGDATLPKLNLESLIGAKSFALLPSLECNSEAVVGTLASGEVNLPLVKLDASALLDVLANFDVSLPKLRVTSDGICGAIVSGGIKLYPLRLNAEGYTGKVGTVDVSLPGLVIEGELAHAPVGEGNMELPYFIVDADGNVTRDPCLGPYILKHRR